MCHIGVLYDVHSVYAVYPVFNICTRHGTRFLLWKECVAKELQLNDTIDVKPSFFFMTRRSLHFCFSCVIHSLHTTVSLN